MSMRDKHQQAVKESSLSAGRSRNLTSKLIHELHDLVSLNSRWQGDSFRCFAS